MDVRFIKCLDRYYNGTTFDSVKIGGLHGSASVVSLLEPWFNWLKVSSPFLREKSTVRKVLFRFFGKNSTG